MKTVIDKNLTNHLAIKNEILLFKHVCTISYLHSDPPYVLVDLVFLTAYMKHPEGFIVPI